MLKLINLFFIGVFIISCGGEVGRVYHNGTHTAGGTNNSGGTQNPSTTNQNIVKLECLPGTNCNKNELPVNANKSSSCLPGVECNSNNTITDTDKNTKTDNNSSGNTNKACLPGQTSC